ncbi:MAG: hypothetical protein R3B82_11525 [Sandaracinaceae bacterium]
MRSVLVSLGVLLVSSTASADVPGPYDDLCTVEIQQRDGSRCEPCSWEGSVQGAYEEACGPLIERGWTRRCGRGATHASAVFCDHEADPVEVGRGGCGCHAARGASPPTWMTVVVALALFARRPHRRR